LVSTRSSSRRSWLTRSRVPSKGSSASSSDSIAARSRWFVGSSSTMTFAPRAISRARSARVRSPGDSEPTGRSTSSAPSPNFASRVRVSATSPRVRARNASSSESSATKVRRTWSISPMTTDAPVHCVPLLSPARPSRAASNVVLPAPLLPAIATRSPRAMCRSTGPRMKVPRRTTAWCRPATSSPLRDDTASASRRSHGSRGSSTTSSRTSARNVLAAAAPRPCALATLAARMNLSRSSRLALGDVARPTPCCAQSFSCRARSTRPCRVTS
jgi:hypothetical protein